VLVSPALPVQLPLMIAVALSGPEYVGLLQATPPEIELPLTLAPTGLVYRPLWSGARASAIETVGPLASYWNDALVAVLVSPALSEQLPLMFATTVSGPE
jgi:hypothetical protein